MLLHKLVFAYDSNLKNGIGVWCMSDKTTSKNLPSSLVLGSSPLLSLSHDSSPILFPNNIFAGSAVAWFHYVGLCTQDDQLFGCGVVDDLWSEKSRTRLMVDFLADPHTPYSYDYC